MNRSPNSVLLRRGSNPPKNKAPWQEVEFGAACCAYRTDCSVFLSPTKYPRTTPNSRGIGLHDYFRLRPVFWCSRPSLSFDARDSARRYRGWFAVQQPPVRDRYTPKTLNRGDYWTRNQWGLAGFRGRAFLDANLWDWRTGSLGRKTSSRHGSTAINYWIASGPFCDLSQQVGISIMSGAL